MQHRTGRAQPGGQRAIARARYLARDFAARLRRAATRVGGDDGAALACAFVDMVLGGDAPVGWPIAELIELLDTASGADRQVGRLLTDLARSRPICLRRRQRTSRRRPPEPRLRMPRSRLDPSIPRRSARTLLYTSEASRSLVQHALAHRDPRLHRWARASAFYTASSSTWPPSCRRIRAPAATPSRRAAI